jgi:exportin-2 (importin alpha re-exporter)
MWLPLAGDPEREGVLDGVKAAVCANINLFMEMNEEEFAKYLQTFVTDVWHLLMQVRAQRKRGWW